MSAPYSLGGSTRTGDIINSSLYCIIKNAAWCKQTLLVSSCKSSLNLLQSLTNNTTITNFPLLGLSDFDSTTLLTSLILALESSSPKLIDPALDSFLLLLSLRLLRGLVDPSSSILSRHFDSLSALTSSSPDDSIELPALKLFLAALQSEVLHLYADALTTSSTLPFIHCLLSSPLQSSLNTFLFACILSCQALVFFHDLPASNCIDLDLAIYIAGGVVRIRSRVEGK